MVRGFGFLHDGAIDTLDHFFRDPVFRFPALVKTPRPECLLMVTGSIEGNPVQLQMTGDDGRQYCSRALRKIARTDGQELTFTCYSPA
jgi:hypothetical protein